MYAAYLYAIVCLGVDSTCKRADVCVVDVHIVSHRWSQGGVTDGVQGSHMGVPEGRACCATRDEPYTVTPYLSKVLTVLHVMLPRSCQLLASDQLMSAPCHDGKRSAHFRSTYEININRTF